VFAFSGFEGDETEAADILLLIVFLLEANDALALFQDDIVPLSHAAVRFHLANGEIGIVAEPYLVDPVLAGFDANLADGSVGWEIYTRLTSVQSRGSGERRAHTVRQVELHRQDAAHFIILYAYKLNVLELAGGYLGEVFLLRPALGAPNQRLVCQAPNRRQVIVLCK